MAFDEKNIQTLRDGLKEINEASTKVRNSSELQERLQSISRQGEMFKKLLADPDQAILTAYWELVQDQIRNVRLFLDTKQESMASEEVDRLVKQAEAVAQDLAESNMGNVKAGIIGVAGALGATTKVCQTVSNRELTNIWLISDRLLHT